MFLKLIGRTLILIALQTSCLVWYHLSTLARFCNYHNTKKSWKKLKYNFLTFYLQIFRMNIIYCSVLGLLSNQSLIFGLFLKLLLLFSIHSGRFGMHSSPNDFAKNGNRSVVTLNNAISKIVICNTNNIDSLL